MAEEERIYVIPLAGAKSVQRYRRTNRAVKIVREFLVKHMKSEDVKIDKSLNEKLWKRGTRKPPTKVRVKAVRQDDGSVVASLAE